MYQFQSPNYPSPPTFLFGNHKCVSYICASFCFIIEFICIIYLDSAYKQNLSFSVCLTSFSVINSTSIQVAPNGINSCYWLSNITLYICATSYLLICQGQLGWLHVLAIVNSTAVNIGLHVSFKPCFSLDVCPRVGLQGHMVALSLVY